MMPFKKNISNTLQLTASYCVFLSLLFTVSLKADIVLDPVYSPLTSVDKVIDSLKSVRLDSEDSTILIHKIETLLEDASNDELTVNTYLKLARLYKRNKFYKESYNFIEKALSQFDDSNVSGLKVEVYIDLADLYRWQANFEGVQKTLKIAENLAVDMAYYIGLVDIYNINGHQCAKQKKYEQASEYYQRALHYAELLENDLEIARICRHLGTATKALKDGDTALAYYQRSLAIFDHHGSHSDILHLLNLISKLEIDRHNFPDALVASYSRIHLCRESSDDKSYAMALNDIAECYRRMGFYEKGLGFSVRAAEIFTRIQDKKGLIQAYIKIALVYEHWSRYTEALAYLKKALVLAEELDSKNYIASALKNIGIIYQNMNLPEKGEVEIARALKLYEELGNFNGVATSLRALGGGYAEQGDYENAYSYYEDAYKYSLIAKKDMDVAYVLNDMAKLLLKLDEIASAKEKLMEAIDLGNKVEAKHILVDVYGQMLEVSKREGDFVEATRYCELIIDIQEQVSSQTASARIAELKALSEIEEKQRKLEENEQTILRLESDKKIGELELMAQKREIEVLNREKKIQELEIEKQSVYRMFFIGLIVLSFGLLLSFIGRYRFAKKMHGLLQEKVDQIELKNEKLQSLNKAKDRFFSIIAHELKGSMGALLTGSKILESKTAKDLQPKHRELVHEISMSTKLTYNLLENLLEWARIQMKRQTIQYSPFKLSDLLENVLADIAGRATTKNIRILCDVDHVEQVIGDLNITETILRNFLVNAIKFTPVNGEIHVYDVIEEENLSLHVRDNGIGIPKDIQQNIFKIDHTESTKGTQGETGTGLGLIICNELIKRQRGSIGFDSNPGEGSDFYFSLARQKKI